MSVTLTPVLPAGTTWTRSESYDRNDWCLCAQMAPNPCDLILTAEGREDLRQHADPNCAVCRGTGVDRQDASLYAPCVNWGNDNAQRMFDLLGINDWECGQLPVGRMRLHLQKARAALPKRGASLERPAHQEMGVCGDAIVPRLISMGLDLEGMSERLEDLERLLNEAESLGCLEISWA